MRASHAQYVPQVGRPQKAPVQSAMKVKSARVGATARAIIAASRVLKASEAAVLLAAGTAYLDVARDFRIVLLNRNQATVLERTLVATEQQFIVGSVTQTDVAQSRARLADQRGYFGRVVQSLVVEKR